MNRQRIIGAVSFPAFLMLWTAGAAVAVDRFMPARETESALAAAARPPAPEPVPLHEPGLDERLHALPAASLDVRPAAELLDDRELWSDAIRRFARDSTVMNGRWQPEPRRVAELDAAGPGAAEPRNAASARVAGNKPRQADRRTIQMAPEGPAPAAVRKRATRMVSRVARLKALARGDLGAGRYSDAYHRLRPNVVDAHGDTEFLALLALAAMRMGSYGEAMVIYERLTRVEPDGGRWHVGLALAREQLGLDATSVYREALALSADSAELKKLLEAKLAGKGSVG